eukprot:CAMPEP_0176239158 /NCGR_PEP_ID=MMETSP0121_2-20121125/28728_1 /TAXON_ID=160619 /ORGANISM="Kryptoperidinium foliaceum, Strain CCMP 1326" /LENGTH=371 /DNA_ID=CAMNT_0017578639 /DNA_START=34 /DNA_END=1149 /DNA_ORIENTATION=-
MATALPANAEDVERQAEPPQQPAEKAQQEGDAEPPQHPHHRKRGKRFFKPWMRHFPGKSDDKRGCGCWCCVLFLLISIAIWTIAYLRLDDLHQCRRNACERLHCLESVNSASTAPCFRESSLCFKNCNSPLLSATDTYERCLGDCPAKCPTGSAATCFVDCDRACVSSADIIWAKERSEACVVASRCEGLMEQEAREIAECKARNDEVPEECDDQAHRTALVGGVGLLPCLTLCCFAFFTEALTIPWLGHDPKSWMLGRGACCLGMALAIIASCIAWGTGTRLELLLYSPGLMVVFCLFNLVAFCCIGLGRVYFAKPVIEVPAPEVPPPEVHVTEKLRAVEPPAVRECAPAEVSERAEDPVARVSAPILQL